MAPQAPQAPQNTMQKLLTVQETAAILGKHPKTIYKFVEHKEIPHIRLPGGAIRFNPEAIIMWFEKRSVVGNIQLNEDQPKLDLSLSDCDMLMMKGEGALDKKSSKYWSYKGIGAVYIKPTPRGFKKWYIWYRDEEGKRKQMLVPCATCRKDAIRELINQVNRIRSKKFYGKDSAKDILFKDFSSMYLNNYAKLRKRSWKTDEKYLRSQIIPFFGSKKLSEINPLDVQTYRSKRLGDGVKGSTINKETTVLKRMLALAIEWGFNIEKNPVAKGNFFSEEEYKRDRVLSFEEEKRLYAEAAPHLQQIITCALSSGMRVGEITSLKWSSVDLDGRVIKVNAENSKSRKQRVIPINSKLYQLLSRLRTLNDSEQEYVFLYRDQTSGKQRPVKSIKVAFRNACRRAKIENLTMHDLRHSYSSRLIQNGVSPLYVRDILGHAKLKTTEIYLHASMEEKRKAVESLVQERREKNLDLLPHCYFEIRKESESSASDLFCMN